MYEIIVCIAPLVNKNQNFQVQCRLVRSSILNKKKKIIEIKHFFRSLLIMILAKKLGFMQTL